MDHPTRDRHPIAGPTNFVAEFGIGVVGVVEIEVETLQTLIANSETGLWLFRAIDSRADPEWDRPRDQLSPVR